MRKDRTFERGHSFDLNLVNPVWEMSNDTDTTSKTGFDFLPTSWPGETKWIDIMSKILYPESPTLYQNDLGTRGQLFVRGSDPRLPFPLGTEEATTLQIKIHSWTDLSPYGSLDHFAMRTHTKTRTKGSSNRVLNTWLTPSRWEIHPPTIGYLTSGSTLFCPVFT